MEKLPWDDSRLRVRYCTKVYKGQDEIRVRLPHIKNVIIETAHRDYDRLNRGSLMYDIIINEAGYGNVAGRLEIWYKGHSRSRNMKREEIARIRENRGRWGSW